MRFLTFRGNIDWCLTYCAWNKGYHRYKWICFISWHTHRNWMWGRIKNETLRQKRWFQFSHCELSIYMVQHSDSTYLHMEYTSKFMRYSRACDSYLDFLNRGLLLTRNLLNQGFLVVKLKSSLRNFIPIGAMTWLIATEIRVTNYHIYVPFVIIRSLSNSWPISWYVIRVTRRVPLVEQKLRTQSIWIHPWFLMGHVLINV
jgi:hypothetical protein